MRTASDFAAARAELLARAELPPASRRSALSALTDQWLAGLFESGGGEKVDAALVAVGGYGRRELSPGSDLDLLLIHNGDIAGLPEAIWYPVWDAKLKLDHSVRTVSEARRVAASDLKVVLGLLDARTIAGSDQLREQLVASVLADWRGLASRRLPELRELVDERIGRDGELAHLLEPDVKESYGGLRDVTILRALAATWLTDLPHTGVEAPRRLLLDVRDALHLALLSRSARASDRLLMQEQDPVAELLGMPDSLDMMRQVSAAGRAIAYASDATWYRLQRVTTRVRRGPLRRLRADRPPQRQPLANGVVEQDGEVVLAADARPGRDPVLVLRTAAAAAQSGLRLSPHTVSRLAEESAPMPVPWPRAARDALVALLGAGRPAVGVWEALDQVGMVERLIPLWTPIRSAPQRNAVHRYTVDRHLVEAAVLAARYQRQVERPDLLLLGALLHDIGKGRPGSDHSVLGAELVGRIAPDLGIDQSDTATLQTLVRHHLLLPEMATRRDLEDPETVRAAAQIVGDSDTLDLLYYLTLADAAATGPKAWSDWKATLVDDLTRRTRSLLQGRPPAPSPGPSQEHLALLSGHDVAVSMAPEPAGLQIVVAADDRPGLLALVAGTLAMHRLDVRSAHTATYDARALLHWTVESIYGMPVGADRLAADIRRALDGSLDLAAALRRREDAYRATEYPFDRPANRVDLVAHASRSATVVEVRAHDRPGTLYRLTRALAGAGADIASAHLESRGANVVDTFYVTDHAGQPLSMAGASEVRDVLQAVLDQP
jgi:[protein-PII] uridylyltransferase